MENSVANISQKHKTDSFLTTHRFLTSLFPKATGSRRIKITKADGSISESTVRDGYSADLMTQKERQNGSRIEFSCPERNLGGNSKPDTYATHSLVVDLRVSDVESPEEILKRLDKCVSDAGVPIPTHAVFTENEINAYWTVWEALGLQECETYTGWLSDFLEAKGLPVNTVRNTDVFAYRPFPEASGSGAHAEVGRANACIDTNALLEAVEGAFEAVGGNIRQRVMEAESTACIAEEPVAAAESAPRSAIAEGATESIEAPLGHGLEIPVSESAEKPPELVLTASKASRHISTPFSRFSALGHEEELAEQAVAAKPFLGRVAALGQATMFYAESGTGKTLLTLGMIIRSIEEGLIDPERLFYLNMDDNAAGLYEKAMLVKPFGVNMLGEGFRGFNPKEFVSLLDQSILDGSARGTMLILDTAKQFVNIMDKSKASTFAQWIRKFTRRGGTVLALAHTNKHRSESGKPIYAGTSDFREDFDAAYTLCINKAESDDTKVVVEFEHLKMRGDMAAKVAYQYHLDRSSYANMLLSVSQVDDVELARMQKRADELGDAPVIDAITQCIKKGIILKSALSVEAGKLVGIGKHSVAKVLDRYAGNDPAEAKWKFKRGNRSSLEFELLDAA